ncbi:MAG: HEPN domain-containing protein [Defluviitaleaceae bacterium]|nr:HEPN domain-containing protein [Defluviitaleaceae bacterium]
MPNLAEAREWLKFAQNDYDFAVDIESKFWPKHMERICYNCQQSAEKALKAILAYHDMEIPKTHNIGILVNECVKYEPSIQMDTRTARQMTSYATISRYPDFVTTWTEADAKLALKYAKQALEMVKESLDLSEKQ